MSTPPGFWAVYWGVFAYSLVAYDARILGALGLLGIAIILADAAAAGAVAYWENG